MDASTLIALGALAITLIGAGAGWLLRFGKVEAAAEVARQSLAKVESLEAEVALFKERVARDYATASMVASVEGRVVFAIDRLADRLDRILEMRPTATRTTRPKP